MLYQEKRIDTTSHNLSWPNVNLANSTNKSHQLWEEARSSRENPQSWRNTSSPCPSRDSNLWFRTSTRTTTPLCCQLFNRAEKTTLLAIFRRSCKSFSAMHVNKGFLYAHKFYSHRIHKYQLISDSHNAILDVRYLIWLVVQHHKSWAHISHSLQIICSVKRSVF